MEKEIAMGHMIEWNRGCRVSKEIWEYIMWHHSELFVHVDSNDAVVKRNCLSLLKDAFQEAKRELMDEDEERASEKKNRRKSRKRVSNMSEEQVERQRQRFRVESDE